MLKVTERDRLEAIRRLYKASLRGIDFYILIVISALIATFGLIAGSEAVIIGGMLINPLIAPLLGLGMGLIIDNPEFVRRSFVSVVVGIALLVVTSYTVSLLIPISLPLNTSILQRATLTPIYIYIAVTAGILAAFAWVWPQASEKIAGAAIAVSLVPPIAVSGIALATHQLAIAGSSAILFGVNMFGIIVPSFITFLLLGFRFKKYRLASVLEQLKESINTP